MHMLKAILIILGTISLTLGLVGIFVPGLPTTPFLLLTSVLYLKSSSRLYSKVISNKWVGSYIRQYQNNKGMLLKQKIYAISLMAIMIALSCILFLKAMPIKLMVIAIGIIGVIVMAFIVPTVNNKTKYNNHGRTFKKRK